MKVTAQYKSEFRIVSHGRVKLFVLGILATLLSSSGYALPQGGEVKAGSATINTPSNTQMNITQNSNRAIINWQSFNIAANEKLNIVQPSSSAMLLSRVVGNDPSKIFGQITANGGLMLINQNGILFGRGSKIDVAALIASTANIKNEDFMAGRMRFMTPSNPNAKIINEGAITVREGGLVALVAPYIQNNGTIIAKYGTIALAGSTTATIDLYGDDLIVFEVPDEIKKTIENSGTMEAGYVAMSVNDAKKVVDSSINMSGIIKAQNIDTSGGKVVLTGGNINLAGTIDASGKKGDGGNVKVIADMSNGNLDFSGKVDISSQEANGGFAETSGNIVKTSDTASVNAKGKKNGEWLIDPVDVVIANSGGTITPTTISNALNNGTNVTIQSDSGSRPGSITVLDTITKSAGGEATLNLYSDGAVIINRGGRIVSTHDKLNVNINAIYGVSNPTYGLVAIGNDNAYAIATNGGNVDVEGLIQTYQGMAVSTAGGYFHARTTPFQSSGPQIPDSRGFIGVGPVPINNPGVYTIDTGTGRIVMRATGGTITLDNHALASDDTVTLRADHVLAQPNILSFNMADEATRSNIETGFGGSTGYGQNFPSNDDHFTPVDISLLGSNLTLLGRDFGTNVYLSNNGYIRLDAGSNSYTPSPLRSVDYPIVAAYYGDVDTRGIGSVYYATLATNENNKAVLTWINAGYYNKHTDKTNTFQLQLENLGREINMRMSYDRLQWTTGDASGGSNGLGGTVARAGFSVAGTDQTVKFEIPSSGNESTMLALADLPGNTGYKGRWSFRLWSGSIPPNQYDGRNEVATPNLVIKNSSEQIITDHDIEYDTRANNIYESGDYRRYIDNLSRLDSIFARKNNLIMLDESILAEYNEIRTMQIDNKAQFEYRQLAIANSYASLIDLLSYPAITAQRAADVLPYLQLMSSNIPSNYRQLADVSEKGSGLDAIVFIDSNAKKLVIVFAGTEDKADIRANLGIEFNEAEFAKTQFEQAMRLFELIKNKPRVKEFLANGGTIELAGYSIGGALAEYVGALSGVQAYAFNPSAVPDDIYEAKGIGKNNANVHIIRSALDTVSASSTAYGSEHVSQDIVNVPGLGVLDDQHSIDALIAGLKNASNKTDTELKNELKALQDRVEDKNSETGKILVAKLEDSLNKPVYGDATKIAQQYYRKQVATEPETFLNSIKDLNNIKSKGEYFIVGDIKVKKTSLFDYIINERQDNKKPMNVATKFMAKKLLTIMGQAENIKDLATAAGKFLETKIDMENLRKAIYGRSLTDLPAGSLTHDAGSYIYSISIDMQGLVKKGLLEKVNDSGLPAYRLTPKGALAFYINEVPPRKKYWIFGPYTYDGVTPNTDLIKILQKALEY